MSDRVRADLALVFLCFLWGSTFVLVKDALDDCSPLLFLAFRFSVALAVLAVYFRGWHWPDPAVKWAELRIGVLAGLCLFGGYLFQTLGLHFTTPSKSAFITGLNVVMVPVLGAALYREKSGLSEIAGVLAAAGGMALMTLEGTQLAIGPGEILTFLCAISYSLHILVIGHYGKQVSFRNLSLTQIATGAVLALGSFWWAEPPKLHWTPALLWAIAITAPLATALAFTLMTWAQQRTTATRAALIFALEPVFAWLTSFLLTGERLSRPALAGAALILGGVLLVELKPLGKRKHPLT